MMDSIILVILPFALYCVGVFVGWYCTDEKWEKEAVRRGFGKHVIINEETGETEFQWEEKA